VAPAARDLSGRDATRLLARSVQPDARRAAARAAAALAERIREAVAARERCAIALSGGATPLPLFEQLARLDVPWRRVAVFQVDERAVPPGDPARNWRALQELLLEPARVPAEQRYPMPVDDPDLEGAARSYARVLCRVAGDPPVLDAVQLGLGADGHTASLFAHDPALEVHDEDVAATAAHAGWRRLTLTLPALNRARWRLWFVTGSDRREALARLCTGAPAALPANRVRRDGSLLLCDAAAARR
jgi:6-phosphogluconolactonase